MAEGPYVTRMAAEGVRRQQTGYVGGRATEGSAGDKQGGRGVHRQRWRVHR